MNKYFLNILIILILLGQFTGYANASTENEKLYVIQFVAGYNYSSFYIENSEWRGNYSFGAKLNFPIFSNININPTILFSRYTSLLRNIEGTYFDTDYLYRRYYDQHFEATFTELILFINYETFQFKSFSIETGIGMGYSFAMEDYSKVTNSIVTDQIIRYNPHYQPLVYSPKEDFSEKSSGITYNANLIINYSRVSISFVYIFKNEKIRNIDSLHVFNFLLGIKL